jgi:peptidoglycan/xylan/chitin deacetylase (PgdA/CDA1 family)
MRHTHKLAATVAVLGLALTGCSASVSGGGDSAPPSGSGTDSAKAPEQIRMADGSPLRSNVPMEVTPPRDTNGLPPVVRSIDTKDKVVFLTIDDGYSDSKKTAKILDRMGIPVTSFLTKAAITQNRDYFQAISQRDGQVIQNHSVSHPSMPGLSQSAQETQICATSDDYQKWTGTRPWMFRPPYGEYNETTQRAAKACGIDYVVNWNVSLPAAHLRYAEGDKLAPGDIILTHWRDDLPRHLKRALRDISRQGFQIGALQDYLPAR